MTVKSFGFVYNPKMCSILLRMFKSFRSFFMFTANKDDDGEKEGKSFFYKHHLFKLSLPSNHTYLHIF